MKKLNYLLVILSLFTFGFCRAEKYIANYQVIPLPQEIVPNQGHPFVLNSSTKIYYPEGNELLKRNAKFLAGYMEESMGKQFDTQAYDVRKHISGIVLSLNKDIKEEEGYLIEVATDNIQIQGQTGNGVFYGIQTLRKSIPSIALSGDIEFQPVTIKDYPRFVYRGMMLDVGRHFLPVEFIKEYIDLLALHNMNTFHWHLTDDQGWRLEIKKYPKLTEIGSKRSRTVIGHHSTTFDEKPHDGYYTQEEIKEVVDHAKERYVNIIPEVDLPGHMLAALAAYPEFGCTGGPYEVACTWGIFDDVLCIGNEQTMLFLEDVLAEVVDMFPSKYIHVGGDEAPRTRWSRCLKCQTRIKTEGLKSDKRYAAEDHLQSYCMARMAKFLHSKGRRIVGWDEILEGEIASDATVMSWRGTKGGIEAARLGHDVIMAPDSHVYFDFYQTPDSENEPRANGGCITVEHVYSLEPEVGLSENEKKHVLGVQANLWAEFIPTPQQAEYMILPRMAALCEVQWTLPIKKEYNLFKQRLSLLRDIYERDGRNYAKHMFETQ